MVSGRTLPVALSTMMERALFRSAGRGSIGDVLAVFGREPPVQRNRAVAGHRVHVNQHAVATVEPFAYIKDRLVLVALAPGVEVILSAHVRSAEGANLQQLRKARLDLVASGKRVENGARVGEFLLDVQLGVRIIRIFEVPVGIDNLVAVDRVLDWSNFGFWRAGREPEGAAGSADRESWANTSAARPMRRIRETISKREPPSIKTSLLLWTRRRNLG